MRNSIQNNERRRIDRSTRNEKNKKNMYRIYCSWEKNYTEQSNTHACPHIFFGAVGAPVFHFIISFNRPPSFIAAAARSKKTLFAPPRVK